MRLLIDENLSITVASRLTQAGHDAVHVTDVGLGNTDDPAILDWAVENGRIVVTADTDFAHLLAVRDLARPSVLLLRSSDHLTPSQQGDLIASVAPAVADDLAQGASSVSPPNGCESAHSRSATADPAVGSFSMAGPGQRSSGSA